jgi:hypothetical protein
MLPHPLDINNVGNPLSKYVHVVSDNDTGYHINDVMSSDKHHHCPLVAHDEEAHKAEAIPLFSVGLHHKDETGANVA